MHMLWTSFCNHKNLRDIVNDFNDQDLSLRIDMEVFETGSTDWCMCEMKRHLLLRQCKKECIEHYYKAPTHSDRCSSCNLVYFIDHATSTHVCKGCGYSVDILRDDVLDYSTMGRFNGNRRHHYDPTEHFKQTLHDFAGTGARRVPVHILSYCRAVLGRGKHITSTNVYDVLRMGGYRAYYLCKYEITSRLRGTPEFELTSHEIEMMLTVYKRYRSEFVPFQQAHYIGTYSKKGKPRLYWPMRYILKRISEEIKRDDLKVFIKGVCDKEKLKLYDFYWDKLKQFVDSTRPSINLANPSSKSVPLGPSYRRPLV